MDLGLILTFFSVFAACAPALIGSAMGVGIAGSAACVAVSEHPRKFSSLILLQLTPGMQGIYGMVIAFMIMAATGITTGGDTIITATQGFLYLAAALPVGLGGLLSAIAQGKTAASAIPLVLKREDGLPKALTLVLMVETYAMFSFLISMLLILGVR